ncbi:MAG TPA: AzlD domain-containing protein [Acidimicrobiales bacterium]|nr:AzlD domain-containing protein [Acidimicrobiales bacterium]
MRWAALLAACAGCYAIKLAGLSVPRRWLDRELVQRVAALLPVALLSTLIVTQTFTAGHRLELDARAVGLVVAVTARLLRAPFIVVVAAAVAATAAVRMI